MSVGGDQSGAPLAPNVPDIRAMLQDPAALQSLANLLAQHGHKQTVGEGGAAVNTPMPNGAVSGSVDGAGAGVWSKAGTSAASSGTGLGGIGAGSQGGAPGQAPVHFRAPVAARVTGAEARNYIFASSNVPAPAAKFQIGAWSDMMLQQCALILNQELNLKGAKVKYKFIPSVFYQEHCIFLSEMISEGQVVGILQPMSQKGGSIVLAIGQIEKDGNFIRLYRCESISGSSRPADVQWTKETILHHANEVIVTFSVTSAVPPLSVQGVDGADGSLLGSGQRHSSQELCSTLMTGFQELSSSIQDLCAVTARAHNKRYKRPRRGVEKEGDDDGDDDDEGADGEEEASAPKRK